MTRYDPEEIERFWREQNPRRRALRERMDARRLPYGVAVENLTKGWNIGNLIRTANAFLCGEIILIGGDAFNETGSAGVYRFEPMHHVPDARAFTTYAHRSGYEIVAVEIDPRAVPLRRFVYPPKPLFLLGSELEGLSADLMEVADHRVMIPQYGLIPCLNVNVSCSLVLYDHLSRSHPDLEPVPVEGSKFKLDPESGRSD